ncbi:MAG: periplasmic protein involved in polysaccharide export [Ferruginibacter sp.]|nr:periplasmic protein involved in polysaccharide export [Ferruginibacter sp.]
MKIKFHGLLVVKWCLKAGIVMVFATIFLSACKIYKPAYYFKDITRDTVITGFVNTGVELKIQKNDVLSISISSLSTEEDALFSKSAVVVEGKTGFQVGPEGNIYLHKLGKMNVAGMTRKELKTRLETELLPYLKDPIVTVNFANHRVTVFGESSSTIVEMPEEKIPLLEVMATSKPVTTSSQLNKVMIIREENNTKIFKHLNLEDPSIFTSPWYFLQPNDIVVVKPNEEKIDTEQKRTRNQLVYTTALSVITFVFLIVDRIFR